MSTVKTEVASAQPAEAAAARLVARYDGRVPRYTSYPTAPHFTPAIGPSVYARWLADLPVETSLSLYLHVPFCDRLCFYCGCNTAVVRLESSHRAYAAMLLREIDRVATLIGRRSVVSHVHWGGGTPTSLPGDCLVAIMNRLKERFAFASDAEIAIEIDPTSLPPDRRDALGAMGVTRMKFSAFRTWSRRSSGRSAASSPTRRPRPAPMRRGRSASARSISISFTACRCKRLRASRGPRVARSTSSPTGSPSSATPMCPG